MEFQTELKKLGLKDKEAAVYLACLELGSSPVQPLARKARVVRATTYVILDALMQRGLVTKFHQGKKTLFSAEPPHRLLRILEKEEEEIKERERDLKRLLPELQMLTKASGDKPTVRYFEGQEGLKAMRNEIIMTSKPGDMIYSFTPTDHLYAVFAREEMFYQQRVAKGVRAKTIFTTRSEKVKEELLGKTYDKFSERRYVPPSIFSSTSGMTIFNDRIAIASYTGRLMGAIIESQPMADMMRVLFNLAWRGAEVYTQ